jgi:hypothetical protein
MSKAGSHYLRIIGNVERERQEQQHGYTKSNAPQQQQQQSSSSAILDDEIPF